MTRTALTVALVVAAGSGERALEPGSPLPKQYRLLGGQAIMARSIRALLAVEEIHHVLPVIHSSQREHFASLALDDRRVLEPTFGGATRQASVLEGLKALAPLRPALILIHDAARPFASTALIEEVIAGLAEHDAVLPGLPVSDTIKRSTDGRAVVTTEDRTTLFAAQTPQGFRFPQILSAHLRASRVPRLFTDDASIAEWAGLRVALSPGSPDNIKITFPGDFARGEQILQGGFAVETRVGTGFDVHPFEAGEAVWLGGVCIPHTHRLKGHSDADVALHALTDAIYGALGEGDIGTHFPPTDPQWRGTASSTFLQHAARLVAERRGRIVNLDVTIVCEAPRVSPHVPAMREAIGSVCGIAVERITVKATTSEQLGFTGRGEGILAMASASIEVPRS